MRRVWIHRRDWKRAQCHSLQMPPSPEIYALQLIRRISPVRDHAVLASLLRVRNAGSCQDSFLKHGAEVLEPYKPARTDGFRGIGKGVHFDIGYGTFQLVTGVVISSMDSCSYRLRYAWKVLATRLTKI